MIFPYKSATIVSYLYTQNASVVHAIFVCFFYFVCTDLGVCRYNRSKTGKQRLMTMLWLVSVSVGFMVCAGVMAEATEQNTFDGQIFQLPTQMTTFTSINALPFLICICLVCVYALLSVVWPWLFSRVSHNLGKAGGSLVLPFGI